MGLLKIPSWCFLLLIFSANVLPTTSLCLLDHKYVISSASTGLVLDSSSDRVTLAHYTGFNPQLWCLEYTSNPSILNIVSFDPLGRGLNADIIGDGHAVYLDNREYNSISQEWTRNSDNTIANVGSNNLCLDGLAGEITVGNSLQLNECSDSEKWILEER